MLIDFYRIVERVVVCLLLPPKYLAAHSILNGASEIERERGKSFFDKHENEGSLCSPGTKAVKRALKSISSGFTWTPCHIVVV